MSDRPAKLRLLVVDDNEDNRDVLSRQLRRRGYEVDCANDGVHALERCSGTRYDLILLDIMMPRMNGIEVVRELRKKLSRSDLPILMVTAKSDDKDVVEALELGANDYIVKPFAISVVTARVKAALRISEEARRPTSGLFGEDTQPDSLGTPRACGYCGTAFLDDPPKCRDCDAERPTSGWPSPSPVDSPHFARIIGQRYFLEKYLTEGSSGEVFRCRDLDLGRIFAAKVIDVSDDKTTDEEAIRERIRVEVQALVRIGNPHVVKIYEVIRLAPKVYALIMDYVRGESLGDLLARGRTFTPHTALALVRQAAQGLHAAHELSLIHRDVKPDNVMVERLPAGDHFVQILDFGIVSRLGEVTGANFYGTPLYASPEQSVYHRVVDHRADIYSLGAVLFHMLTGTPPFLGDTVEEILTEHASAPVPQLNRLADSERVTAALDELVGKMMAKSPTNRFATMAEVIGRIDELLPLLSYEDVLPSSADPLGRTVEPESAWARGETDRRATDRRPIPTLDLASAGSAKVSHARLRYPIRTITETVVTGDSHALVVEQADDACHVTALDFANATITRWLVLDGITVRAVSLSLCGHFFAVAEAEGPAMRVFGTASRREMRSWTWALPDVSAIALSHEARMIAVATEGGELAIADTWGTNQPLALGDLGSPISALAFAPDGGRLAVGCDDRSVRLLAIPTGEEIARETGLVAPPVQIAYFGDGADASVLTSAGHVITLGMAPLATTGQTRITGLASIRYAVDRSVIGLVACDGDWEMVDCEVACHA